MSARKWRTLEPLPAPEGLMLGDVVLVTVINKRERAEAGLPVDGEGKVRPAVWLMASPRAGWTGVAGLTTKPRFDNGEERRPASGQFGYYAKPSYLWGGRVTWVTNDSILRTLGRVDADTLDAALAHYGPELRQQGFELD